jgi:hypothetical protein
VVTTAKLWATDAALDLASLETGDLDRTSTKFQEVGSVALQYHRSPSLVPAHVGRIIKTELSQVLDEEYSRTVHIVGPSGFDEFMSTLSREMGSLD